MIKIHVIKAHGCSFTGERTSLVCAFTNEARSKAVVKELNKYIKTRPILRYLQKVDATERKEINNKLREWKKNHPAGEIFHDADSFSRYSIVLDSDSPYPLVDKDELEIIKDFAYMKGESNSKP